MKRNKIYSTSNFALQVVQMALEVQFGKQVRLHEVSYDTEPSENHPAENGGNPWQSKQQDVWATFTFKGENKLMQLDDVQVELVRIDGVWRSCRIFFAVKEEMETHNYVWYVAHSEYSDDEKEEAGLLYPTIVRVALRYKTGPEWRAGTGASDVIAYPWHELNVFQKHPAMQAINVKS